MIYKVIEDKKWEYKVKTISEYDLMHNQLDSVCDGDEGWEAFQIFKQGKDYQIFLKRSYVEINKDKDE